MGAECRRWMRERRGYSLAASRRWLRVCLWMPGRLCRVGHQAARESATGGESAARELAVRMACQGIVALRRSVQCPGLARLLRGPSELSAFDVAASGTSGGGGDGAARLPCGMGGGPPLLRDGVLFRILEQGSSTAERPHPAPPSCRRR